MFASPRVKWLSNAVCDLLGVGAPSEADALLRDPDAAAVVAAFLKGPLEAIVFFYQPKEVCVCVCMYALGCVYV